MTAFIPAGTSWSPWLCYVNPAPSSVITNTTAETAFDQVFTIPCQSQRGVGLPTVFRIKAYGIFSTGLLNLGLTFRVRWGGIGGQVICQSGSYNLMASASNAGWTADLTLVIQGSGSSAPLESQGCVSFATGVLGLQPCLMANGSTFNVDMTTPNDLVFTAQWATAAAANQIQLRTCVIEVDGP